MIPEPQRTPTEARGASVPIAVVILTYNEEMNLTPCLESVSGWAEEIFVIDSGSTDATQEIARKYLAQVIQHEFESPAVQFNWALDTLPIRSPWILRLDADEFLLPELRDEISAMVGSLPDSVSGLLMKRRMYFMGRWMRHGDYYPVWLLRLFRRGKARSEAMEMDEHIVVTEGETRHLVHDFVDYNRKGLAFWLAKHARYGELHTSLEMRIVPGEMAARLLGDQRARKRWLKTKVYWRAPLFIRAFAYFLYRYFGRLGFLDGMEGFIFHVMHGLFYRFYMDSIIWESSHSRVNDAGGSPPSAPDPEAADA